MPKYFDNTRVSTFKTCPRKFYFRHVRHWERQGLSMPLLFGISWHAGMDVLWKFANTDISNRELLNLTYAGFLTAWAEEGGPDITKISPPELDQLKARTPMIAKEMFTNYIEQRRERIRGMEIIGIEVPLAVPIFKDRPDIMYVAKVDKIVRRPDINNRIYVIEHKTTSSYRKGGPFRHDWIESWSPNAQIDGQAYCASMLYGSDVKGVLVDGALVHKTVWDGFKFIPIERAFNQLDAWLWEARDWITKLEREKAVLTDDRVGPTTQVMRAFPKNTESCNHYAGCTYRDLCKVWSNPEEHECPEGFRIEKWSPFQKLELSKLGLKEEE